MVIDRPCHYFTILREPVARLVSAYNYFCLSCSEDGKFCHALPRNTSAPHFNAVCPNMPFLEFASIFANMYTWHFSGRWHPASWQREFYGGYMQGFARDAPLTEADLAAAKTALNASDMLVLLTDELSDASPSAWDKLDAWLAGTRAAAALRPAAAQRVRTNTYETSAERSAYLYKPTTAELERACVSNHFDCSLYRWFLSRRARRAELGAG